MGWKSLELDDKPLFDRHFAERAYGISDLNFTNLFLWHFSEEIAFRENGGFFCIRVRAAGAEPRYLMPLGTGDLRSCVGGLADDALQIGTRLVFRSITREMREEMEAVLPGAFAFEPARARYDYVYAVRDLIELSGERYHAKKNHLNKFRTSYQWRYQPLTPGLLDAVAQSESDWCQRRECGRDEGLRGEQHGILETLKQFGRLDYKGGVITIGDKVCAFTLGEALSGDTVVIHIEKADPEVRGAYAAINQQFLENEWPQMTWVNREEDLGIDGLRKAKLSYHPARMVEKCYAVLRR